MNRFSLKILFSKFEFSGLLVGSVRLFQSLKEMQAQIAVGNVVTEPDAYEMVATEVPWEFLDDAICSALISLRGSNMPVGTFLSEWEKSFDCVPCDLPGMIDFPRFRELLNMGLRDQWKALNDSRNVRHLHCLAAVSLGYNTTCRLEEVFCSHAFLLTLVNSSMFREEIEGTFETMVRSEWLKRLSFPAQFLTPRVSIPEILGVCKSGFTGVTFVAKLLLVAKSAVCVHLNPESISAWRAIGGLENR